MKHFAYSLFLFLILLCSSVSADEIMNFELTDGSIIHGRLISFSNGRYTIHSDSLGTLKISETKVKLIRRGNQAAAVERSAKPAGIPSGMVVTAGPEVQGLVNEMQGNEDIMPLIRALQDDPEMRALVNDPAVMKAISAGDLGALTANPKFMKLLKNPKVQEIQKKMLP